MPMDLLFVYEYILYAFCIIFFVGAIDDLLIDTAHFVFNLTPKNISKAEWKEINKMEEKPIAIMVPAWREHDVLEAMVTTNLKRIKYQNFKWFIGVYPNDKKTLSIALNLQERFTDKVIVVINDKEGPTTKAQMINKVLDTMKGAELAVEDAWIPHYIGIHDAEDVIHPLALKAINAQDETLDFIQLPIFSLPVDYKSWVAGTYMDDFADLHLKEIPVRQKLRMPIPSAGVGTFFSNKMMDILGSRFGYYLDEGNLTEDYEISMRIARLGGKQSFLFLKDDQGQIISTREYFPNSFATSVRQKTRWTTGIGLQTMLKWGSFASLKQNFSWKNIMGKYACWRDQKALWANPLIYIAWALLVTSSVIAYTNAIDIKQLHIPTAIQYLLSMNLGLFCIRVIQRFRFSATLYGLGHGLLSFPRLYLGSVINANAALKASFNFNKAPKVNNQKKVEWDKTQHYFPTEEKINESLGRSNDLTQ
jgi:adsorption protein B